MFIINSLGVGYTTLHLINLQSCEHGEFMQNKIIGSEGHS